MQFLNKYIKYYFNHQMHLISPCLSLCLSFCLFMKRSVKKFNAKIVLSPTKKNFHQNYNAQFVICTRSVSAVTRFHVESIITDVTMKNRICYSILHRGRTDKLIFCIYVYGKEKVYQF